MNIRLEQVTKRFAQQVVVKEIDLEIREGELLLLLGPSGCGKTTVLRLLAGFTQPDSGQLLFNGQSVVGIPTEQRPTAMVFQNYALWPHLTVFENVAYGLRVRRLPQPEIDQRVKEALEQVKMSAYSDRKPTQLSGGQQQRVALARAFVVRPSLLLFDEPLCNLDQQLRLEMRAEIKRLHAETGITSLYVTHDQEEALALATRIAIMHQGVIQQIGTPTEVYHRPATRFVARFIGEMNLYPAERPLARLRDLAPNQALGFRPESVRLSTESPGVPAWVKQSTFLGSRHELILQTHEGDTIKACSTDGFPVDSQVFCDIPLNKLLTFDGENLI